MKNETSFKEDVVSRLGEMAALPADMKFRIAGRDGWKTIGVYKRNGGVVEGTKVRISDADGRALDVQAIASSLSGALSATVFASERKSLKSEQRFLFRRFVTVPAEVTLNEDGTINIIPQPHVGMDPKFAYEFLNGKTSEVVF